MDSACTSQDQRKRRRARISAQIKKASNILDQLLFPRRCVHCNFLLKEPKQRLCPACLDLLDPRAATYGCRHCLKPLQEMGEEKSTCTCKLPISFDQVIYLEPIGGVLQSLIQAKALQEEKEILLALSAYLVQIALEANQPLPNKIMTYGLSKEESGIQRALEAMLKLEANTLTARWEKLWLYLSKRFPKYFRNIFNDKWTNQTVWVIGLKKNQELTKSCKEILQIAKAKEAILLLISCS